MLTTGLFAPAWAGPPFATDDPEPIEYGQFEIYLFSAGTSTAQGTTSALPGLEVNYGPLPEVQLNAVLPVAFENADGQGMHFAFDDLKLGAKYRFVDEDENGWRPQIATYPSMDIVIHGNMSAFLPIWVQKSFGAWTTFGGGGYWNNPGAGNRDYWFAGWAVVRQFTNDLMLGGEVFHQTANRIGGEESTGFNVGGKLDLDDVHHIVFSAGRGIQNAADTNRFSYYLGLEWLI